MTLGQVVVNGGLVVGYGEVGLGLGLLCVDLVVDSDVAECVADARLDGGVVGDELDLREGVVGFQLADDLVVDECQVGELGYVAVDLVVVQVVER